mgnify:CR=1 FL=1
MTATATAPKTRISIASLPAGKSLLYTRQYTPGKFAVVSQQTGSVLRTTVYESDCPHKAVTHALLMDNFDILAVNQDLGEVFDKLLAVVKERGITEYPINRTWEPA